jgi:hypothetical protein
VLLRSILSLPTGRTTGDILAWSDGVGVAAITLAPLTMAALPRMLEHDRKRAGWTVEQAARLLGVIARSIGRSRPNEISRVGDMGPESARCSAGSRRSRANRQQPK